jgi:hypothetical protein
MRGGGPYFLPQEWRVEDVDKANFIRKFKRVEGMTPLKYRMLYNREWDQRKVQ